MSKNILSPFLEQMVSMNGSDVYLTVGLPVSVRTQDSIIKITHNELEESFLLRVKEEILNEDQIDELETTFELNISLKEDNGSRFRLNFFYQQGKIGIVVRLINSDIPTIEGLNLPNAYKEIIMKKHGLVLVASSTGSGKSSSMAAMIDHRNENGMGHIITIEDPIEFVHKHKNCIITQREVGIDTYSYEMALRNALRQRADVVVIGEIRDRDSIEYAMKFAETGHLCIATMHSNNTSQAIERITSLFPDEARSNILSEISNCLLSVFSQKLIQNNTESLSIATEILLNEGLIKNLIAEDRVSQIPEAIARNLDTGMQSMNQSIFKLFEKGDISLEAALRESDNISNLKLMINQSGIVNCRSLVG